MEGRASEGKRSGTRKRDNKKTNPKEKAMEKEKRESLDATIKRIEADAGIVKRRWTVAGVSDVIRGMREAAKKHGPEIFESVMLEPSYARFSTERINVLRWIINHGAGEKVASLLRYGMRAAILTKTENGIPSGMEFVQSLNGIVASREVRERLLSNVLTDSKVGEEEKKGLLSLLRAELAENGQKISNEKGVARSEEESIKNALSIGRLLRIGEGETSETKKIIEKCERKKAEEEKRREEDRESTKKLSEIDESRMTAMVGLATAGDTAGFVALGDFGNIWEKVIGKRKVWTDLTRNREETGRFAERLLRQHGKYADAMLELLERGENPWEVAHEAAKSSPMDLIANQTGGAEGLTAEQIKRLIKFCKRDEPAWVSEKGGTTKVLMEKAKDFGVLRSAIEAEEIGEALSAEKKKTRKTL